MRRSRRGDEMKGMDPLLVKVLERGWSRRRRRQFITRYGRTIRGSILYHIRLRFGNRSLASLSDYLLSLQEGKCPRSQKGVIGEVLDLAADTWQDVLNEVFKVKDNLVHKYHRYIQVREEGRGITSFPYFLSKSVQYKFLDNLKARLVGRQAHDSIDERGAAIAGIATNVDGDVDIREDGEADKIPLNDEVNYYWDQLIRCLEPDPDQVEELIKLYPNEGSVLCWACAKMKRRFKRREQKENLIAFIVFYSSKRGVGGTGAPAGSEGLDPESLTLERVAGRDLRWREDVCKGIFGKYIRKDRVMEQIKREIMNSEYSYFIAG